MSTPTTCILLVGSQLWDFSKSPSLSFSLLAQLPSTGLWFWNARGVFRQLNFLRVYPTFPSTFLIFNFWAVIFKWRKTYINFENKIYLKLFLPNSLYSKSTGFFFSNFCPLKLVQNFRGFAHAVLSGGNALPARVNTYPSYLSSKFPCSGKPSQPLLPLLLRQVFLLNASISFCFSRCNPFLIWGFIIFYFLSTMFPKISIL